MKCNVIFSAYYHWKKFGMIVFNLLPTIEFSRDNSIEDIGDYSMDICFGWLFWMITFRIYWGSVYKKRGED